MIKPAIIGGDEDLARQILVIARSIAPCIQAFPDGSENQENAIAILRLVYKECVNRGSRGVKSQRVGPASVEYFDIRSAFDGDPRIALQALCPARASSSSPLGSFPASGVLGRVWPEGGRTG